MRRLAIVMVSPEFIVRLLKEGCDWFAIAENSLPADSKIAGVGQSYYAADYAAIALVIESSQFDEVPEGKPLPILPVPKFRKVFPQLANAD